MGIDFRKIAGAASLGDAAAVIVLLMNEVSGSVCCRRPPCLRPSLRVKPRHSCVPAAWSPALFIRLLCCCCCKQTAYSIVISFLASICMYACISSVLTSFLLYAYCYMQYAYSILCCAPLLFFISSVRLSYFVVYILLVAVYTYSYSPLFFLLFITLPQQPHSTVPLCWYIFAAAKTSEVGAALKVMRRPLLLASV